MKKVRDAASPVPERLYVAVPRRRLFEYLEAPLDPVALAPSRKAARERGSGRAIVTVLAWEAAREGVQFAAVEGGWAPDRPIDAHLLGCRDRKALRSHKVRRARSAGAVIVSSLEDPRVLVVERRAGGRTSWKTPKGKIERGEAKRRAARREVREETGLSRLRFVADLGNVQYFRREGDGRRCEKTVRLYLAVNRDGACGLTPREGERIVGGEWLEPAEAIARVTRPELRGAFARAAAFLAGR